MSRSILRLPTKSRLSFLPFAWVNFTHVPSSNWSSGRARRKPALGKVALHFGLGHVPPSIDLRDLEHTSFRFPRLRRIQSLSVAGYCVHART